MAKADSHRGVFQQHRGRGRPRLNTLGAPAEAAAEAIRRSEQGEDWPSVLRAVTEQFRRSERTIYRWLKAELRDRQRAEQIARHHPKIAARFRDALVSAEVHEQAQRDDPSRK